MSTHWTTGLVPPSKPTADGVARAQYLRQARNQRRTKGRSDWDRIKSSSKFKRTEVYAHSQQGIPRLSKQAIAFVLRERHGRLYVTPMHPGAKGRVHTGEAERAQTLSFTTPRFSLNRVIRGKGSRTKIDGMLVRSFESRDMHAHRWDPVQARYMSGPAPAPRPTRAPLSAEEIAARIATESSMPLGKEHE